MSDDLVGRGNLDELGDVQGGDPEHLGKAEFAERSWVISWSQLHVLALESPHAFGALNAQTVEDDLGDLDGLFRVDLLLAGWAAFISQGPLHLFLFQPFLLFLSVNKTKRGELALSITQPFIGMKIPYCIKSTFCFWTGTSPLSKLPIIKNKESPNFKGQETDLSMSSGVTMPV